MARDGAVEEWEKEKEKGPPETMKRENTCLIMEDDTMLI
jgi:hypothetical protein